MIVTADDGRLYLPKAVRERVGQRFELIERADRVILVPLPDDPLTTLRAEWEDVEADRDTLREQADQDAATEAGR